MRLRPKRFSEPTLVAEQALQQLADEFLDRLVERRNAVTDAVVGRAQRCRGAGREFENYRIVIRSGDDRHCVSGYHALALQMT